MRYIDADILKEKILAERDKIPLEIVERYSFGVPTPYRHGQSMRGGIRVALRCMEETPTIDAIPVVRCRDCRYFEYDHFEKVNDFPVPLIVAHEICTRWSDGCKTSEDGFCFMGERRTDDG